MYKKGLFLLLFSLPLFVFSQEFNKLDAQGKRHGVWEKRYDSGRIRYTGVFEHGKEVGEFLFYENKIINNYPSIKKVFSKNSDEAKVTFYDINGKKKSEGTMIGKNRVGTWNYYDYKGRLILSENYKNNKLDGPKTVFYENDSIAELSEYKNGKLNGISSRFSKKGIKLHEMTYEDGLLHGRTKFFEVNGNIKESGLYYKDYKVGKWDFYIDGEYMGYKEPNKKRDRPSDEAILASINGKKEEVKEYPELTDEEIMENIEQKRTQDFSYEKLSDDEILNNIETKKGEKRTYSKITDDEILNNISSKMDKKIKEIESLKDEDILKNIERKKEETKKENIKKLTDEEILENIKNKKAKGEK